MGYSAIYFFKASVLTTVDKDWLAVLDNLRLDIDREAGPDLFGAAVVMSIIFLSLTAALRKRKSSWVVPTLKVTSLVMIAIALALGINTFIVGHSPSLRSFIALFTTAIHILWIIPMTGGALFTVLLPILLATLGNRRRGILLGFTTTFVVIRFWLFLFAALWFVGLNLPILSPGPNAIGPETKYSLRFVGLVWLELAAMGGVFLITLLSNRMKAAKADRAQASDAYPRLIVPTAALVLPIVLTATSIAAIVLCHCGMSPVCSDNDGCRMLDAIRDWIVFHPFIILLLGGALVHLTHGQFKVTNDIVSYFKINAPQRTLNPLSAIAMAYNYSPLDAHSFRAAIAERFRSILRDIWARFGDRRIAVIAHSLGTVIAIDALRGMTEDNKMKDAAIDLVTMGSPYSNIFEYYFPHMFGRLDQGEFPLVRSLTNIYRADDFVGTRLCVDSGAWEEGAVEQIAQPAKGHFGYFADHQVLRAYAERLYPSEESLVKG
jgi:hypothetical protein